MINHYGTPLTASTVILIGFKVKWLLTRARENKKYFVSNSLQYFVYIGLISSHAFELERVHYENIISKWIVIFKKSVNSIMGTIKAGESLLASHERGASQHIIMKWNVIRKNWDWELSR
jgi:hypothetical protein